ncbi:N-acetylmuramoyl-L-alanine amidase [Leptolyngbyaceae cyanobacterium UHCC 1019]
MNISSLRFLAWSAIALSPFGFANTAMAAPGSFVVPTVPINAPTVKPPSTGGNFPYSRSPGSAVVIPTVPTFPTYPTVTTPGKLPPLPNQPTLTSPSTSNSKLAYRVVVNNTDAAKVSAVIPGAFRTTVNGQSVIQVGVFQEQGKATELQQILNRNNLQAVILPVQASELPSRQPAPITNPSPIVTTPGKLPPLPNQPTPSPITQPSTSNSKLAYRVVVNGSDAAKVSAVAPGAFRTTVNGQTVIQVGLFQEQGKAIELQQILNRNNLQAMILPMQASEVPSRQPAPTTNPSRNPNPIAAPIPKSGITVVIDPGHGGGDPGAVGIGGLQEKEVVLSVSQQVVALLKQKGVNAVMTRSRDQEIELAPRVQFAEQANADVFVSIHANAFTASRPDVSGIETFYYAGEGQSLARSIQTNLVQALGARDRGVKQANFYVLRNTPMPSALVEVGFVTGAEDAARLANPSDRTRIAQAIARGILQYVQ